jgi:hypothetical protein
MTQAAAGILSARVLSARIEFVPRTLSPPLVLSTGTITEITEAQAEVRVRVDGREAVGRGSIYLSDLWAWPDPQLSHAVRDAAMQALCRRIAARLPELCGGEPHHPLELGMRLHDSVMALGGTSEPAESPDGPIERMPALGRGICLSPFDAAIHDAVGQALGISAFAFYDAPQPMPTADAWFPRRDRGSARAVGP